ncbi:glycerate kinase [Streptococcus agalactiae]|nr:glycerate kinase [Streptococcus agalactiae]
MEKGILAVFKDADIQHVLADGGEGTVDSLVDATGGTRVPVRVAGPLRSNR